MNEEKRNIRIDLMVNLYQHDLYQSERIAFIPRFESDAAKEVYERILARLPEIDAIITNNLYNYRLNRLAYLDRAIIRLAVFEMVFQGTAKEIAIDEAVELTKIYSDLDDMKQHRFTNRLLDNIARNAKG
ncbi:MAG: transcription antitermination protein NusB [Acholeplasmataceae bacterium]